MEWKHHFAHLAAAAANAGTDATTPDAVRAVLAAETGWDDLAQVDAPLTLVRGERGFVTAADAEELRRRVPAAEVRVLPPVTTLRRRTPPPSPR